MVNTTARAHVVGPDQIPASASASDDLENHPVANATVSNKNDGAAIFLGRKKSRKVKAQGCKIEKLEKEKSEAEEKGKTTKREPELAVAQDDDDNDDNEGSGIQEDKQPNRKERRRLKREKAEKKSLLLPSAQNKSTTPASSRVPSTSTSQTTNFPILYTQPETPRMPPATYHPLLVCSIGNPGPQYAQTLHSTGHFILQLIRERGNFRPWQKGMGGLMAPRNDIHVRLGMLTGVKKSIEIKDWKPGEDYFTLWQSTKFMNVSGPGVKGAWREFSERERAKGMEPRLVVVHDELEAELGRVGIKEGKASPRGHNGLKSVQASMGSGAAWWRVGVGIGRPESRDAQVVSRFVLRKINYAEGKKLDAAAYNVLEALRRVAEGRM